METASPSNPFRQQNGGADLFCSAPTPAAPASNGTGSPFGKCFREEDDFGPETDVDAVDDSNLSSFAAAKAFVAQKGPLDDDEELERQRMQLGDFDDPTEADRSRNTPTPPAHDVVGFGEADNVAESGGEGDADDSEDDEEWNYYKGEEDKTDKKAENKTEQELADEADMESQLNPNAAEFVPVSPTHGRQHDVLDDVISASPMKGSEKNLESVIVPPSQDEFNLEASRCAASLESDSILEGNLGAISKDNLNDTRFTYQSLADESEILSTKAEFGDSRFSFGTSLNSSAAFVTDIPNDEEKGISGSMFQNEEDFDPAMDAPKELQDLVSSPEPDDSMVPGTPRSTIAEASISPKHFDAQLMGLEQSSEFVKSPEQAGFDFDSNVDEPQRAPEPCSSPQRLTFAEVLKRPSPRSSPEPPVEAAAPITDSLEDSDPATASFNPFAVYNQVEESISDPLEGARKVLEEFVIKEESQEITENVTKLVPEFETNFELNEKTDIECNSSDTNPFDEDNHELSSLKAVDSSLNDSSFVTIRKSPIEDVQVEFDQLKSPDEEKPPALFEVEKQLESVLHQPDVTLILTDKFDSEAESVLEKPTSDAQINFVADVSHNTEALYTDTSAHDLSNMCGIDNSKIDFNGFLIDTATDDEPKQLDFNAVSNKDLLDTALSVHRSSNEDLHIESATHDNSNTCDFDITNACNGLEKDEAIGDVPKQFGFDAALNESEVLHVEQTVDHLSNNYESVSLKTDYNALENDVSKQLDFDPLEVKDNHFNEPSPIEESKEHPTFDLKMNDSHFKIETKEETLTDAFDMAASQVQNGMYSNFETNFGLMECMKPVDAMSTNETRLEEEFKSVPTQVLSSTTVVEDKPPQVEPLFTAAPQQQKEEALEQTIHVDFIPAEPLGTPEALKEDLNKLEEKPVSILPAAEVADEPTGTPPPTPAPGLVEPKPEEKKEGLIAAAAAAAGAAAVVGGVVAATKPATKKPTTLTSATGAKKPLTSAAPKKPTDLGAKPAPRTGTTKPAPAKTATSTAKPTTSPIKKTATTTATSKPSKPLVGVKSSTTVSKPAASPASKPSTPTGKPSTPLSKPSTPTASSRPSSATTKVSPTKPIAGVKPATTAPPKPKPSTAAKPLTNGDVAKPTARTTASAAGVTKKPTTAAKPASAVKSTTTTSRPVSTTTSATAKTATATARPKPASASAAKPSSVASRPASSTTAKLPAKPSDKTGKETVNKQISSARPAAARTATSAKTTATTLKRTDTKATTNGKAAPAPAKPAPKATSANAVRKPSSMVAEEAKKKKEAEEPTQEHSVTTTNGYASEVIEEDSLKKDESPVENNHQEALQVIAN